MAGHPGEKITEGLDRLRERLAEYVQMGARFARAIQQPALDIWLGKPANLIAAQQALYHRAKCNQAARRGQYNTTMDLVQK